MRSTIYELMHMAKLDRAFYTQKEDYDQAEEELKKATGAGLISAKSYDELILAACLKQASEARKTNIFLTVMVVANVITVLLTLLAMLKILK